jgi:hypothetical protein
MATEATAAALAAEGTSAGAGALTAVGTGLKAFLLANPVSLAAVAGLVVGAGGYYLLARQGNKQEHEHEETEEAGKAEEAAQAA